MIEVNEKKLKVGTVEIDITTDLSSMMKTLDWVDTLDRAQLEQLGEAYGVKIGAGHPPSALRIMVKSYVQNDWYVATRGEIPIMVQKNHEKRAEQIQKEASKAETSGNGEPKAPRAPRALSKFTMADLSDGQATELGKVRGQRQIVVEHLKKLGTANAEEIASSIEASGVPYPSKDTVVNSVKYHLKGLRDGAFVKEVPTETAAAAE